MVRAYSELHRGGHAHSIEAWRNGELVGGLYGLSLGRVFFGESMFASETDASKVALAGLVSLLRARNDLLIDCQQETAHLASFGARPIPRRIFAAELGKLVNWDPSPEGWPRGRLPDPA
jgi:leucyl/phenylalanyl-tRNA--protein transferase